MSSVLSEERERREESKSVDPWDYVEVFDCAYLD